MAGHNKWSKIKRQKAATDIKRSKAWARVSREITIAARHGGGDPSTNAKLTLAVQKAKGENMPKDTILRAIKRGTGTIEGHNYEEHTYEGYAPHGVAVLIETLTDNTKRTVADLRSMFTKSGGSLSSRGMVAYLFEKRGVIQVSADDQDELTLFELAADAGAIDLELDGDTFMITTSFESFETVQAELLQAGIPFEDARLVRLPSTFVELGADKATTISRFLERLEMHQDVQAVYSNLDASA